MSRGNEQYPGFSRTGLAAFLGLLVGASAALQHTSHPDLAVMTILLTAVLAGTSTLKALPVRERLLDLALAAQLLLFARFTWLYLEHWLHGKWFLCASLLLGADVALAAWVLFRPAFRPIFPLFMAVHAALLFVCVTGDNSVTDVRIFQELAAKAILHGVDPYTIRYPDIYPPASSARFYGAGVSVDGFLIFGFPYPPLAALLVVPGQIVGEIRYVHVSTLLATGWLVRMLARKREQGVKGAMLVLLLPLQLDLLGGAWTETIVGCFIVSAAAASVRVSRIYPLLVGATVTVKQYMVLLAPVFLLLEPRNRPLRTIARDFSIGLVPFAALLMFFLLLDAEGFVGGVVEFHLRQPLRGDSLSVLAWIASRTGWQPGVAASLLSLTGALAATVLCLKRLRRSPADFGMGIATVVLWFFAFSKQGHFNYFYLAVVGFAIVVAAEEPEQTP